ncbi:putative carboxylic ester hydrolase [Lupinus albus]|uniref:Phospholipase A1 n=1 Tax=Lupinus albus TaxID=3870 RepID=A0A6A4PNZ5_LUPAL|nr:putative carboxylic ester hydrolase [Lupinus albus]
MKSLSREPWSTKSNWLEFVCVSTDEGKKMSGRRDIVSVWRGTVQALEWVNDFEFIMVPAPKVFGKNTHPKVHQGWYSIYISEDSRSPFNKTSAKNMKLYMCVDVYIVIYTLTFLFYKSKYIIL